MYEITKITDRKGNDKLDAESLARKRLQREVILSKH